MKDGFGREIDYLRISVTDKCNLRCRYCMPPEGVDIIPHEEVLTLEEIYRIVRIMESLGVRKLRFTGGEPLVRKNLVKLISDVNSLCGIEDIAMTTNGVLLKENIGALKDAGLKRVNISLDTCDRDIFESITGYDGLGRVMESIDASLSMGLQVKLNCVPCREFNEGEIEALAQLAKEKNLDVRFIELMPMGCGKSFHGIASGEILERLKRKYGTYQKVPAAKRSETAQYYLFEGFQGRIGFISPMSHRFCSECNRIRLTVEGRLKLCLHYNDGIELKPLLREGKSDEEIRECIAAAVRDKPKEHAFLKMAFSELVGNHVGNEIDNHTDKRKMVQIGG